MNGCLGNVCSGWTAPAGRHLRKCAGCNLVHTRIDFSDLQWYKEDGTSRCKRCVAKGVPPASSRSPSHGGDYGRPTTNRRKQSQLEHATNGRAAPQQQPEPEPEVQAQSHLLEFEAALAEMGSIKSPSRMHLVRSQGSLCVSLYAYRSYEATEHWQDDDSRGVWHRERSLTQLLPR